MKFSVINLKIQAFLVFSVIRQSRRMGMPEDGAANHAARGVQRATWRASSIC
jgi:hypothetical protein